MVMHGTQGVICQIIVVFGNHALKTGTRFLGSERFQFKFTGAAGFDKFLAWTRAEGSPLHSGLFEKFVNVGGFFFMPLVYRCGYGFADLLYDFAGDFLVFYLRRLYGFDFDGHFVTSCFESIRFLVLVQGEKFDVLGASPRTLPARTLMFLGKLAST
jgi:hypothetical protein